MLHLPDPALMRAVTRYHADGQCKDPYAHHRHTLTQMIRQARHDRWLTRWSALRKLWPRPRSRVETCES